MPTSSPGFETILRPDARLRRIVWLCACLTATAGALIILAMPLSWYVRIPLVIAWAVECCRELAGLARGAARLNAVRLDADGNIAGVGPDGRPEPLGLLSGSTVLTRMAWLRLAFPDGSKHGELFTGNPATDPAWHRLQLLWVLRRGAFGRPQGS